MSIATAIENAQQKVANAYAMVGTKGGTLPATQNLSNLPTAIDSIPTGGGGGTIESLNVTPSTSAQTITASGGVDGYSPVNVSAVTSSIDSNITAGNIKKNVVILGVTGSYEGEQFIGIPRELVNGKMQQPAENYTYTIPDAVTDLGGYVLYGAFYGDRNLTSFNSNNLSTVTGGYAMSNAFQSALSLISADFPNLTSISNTQGMGSAFYQCSALASVSFPSLTTVSGASAMSTCFRNCIGLTQLNFPSLVTISGASAFSGICNGCTNIVTVSLPSLELVTGSNAMLNAFQNNTSLVNISFPKLKTIGADVVPANYGHLSGVFNGCTQITTMTFPELKEIYCNGSTSGSYGTFANNVYLEKLYFPKLNTITYGTGASSANRHACKNIFYGCSALTELHFAATNKTAIEATDGYATAWGRGAGNVTIYFDL